MNLQRLIFRVRAAQRMFQWEIGDSDIRYVLVTGKILKNDPDHLPIPIKLIAGSPGGRPLEVAIAESRENRETIILTAYESQPEL